LNNDPLLQPYQLKHLTFKNRFMTTSHEPAYSENGMPTERYAAYHEARAKAGVALAMTAGSASVSRDSPPAFSNVLAYKDEVVPWIRNLTDACHEHGCAVMIQLSHLGRRTGWNKGDWLPSISSSRHREPAHRAFPKLGHLLDQFWSPLTNELDGPYGADTLDNRMRLPLDVLSAIRDRVGDDFIIGFRYTADEVQKGGITAEEGLEISKRLTATGQVDFLNVIRGRIHTDPAMTDVIPVQGMQSAPHLDFAGAVRKATGMPVFHAARIPDVATARHAVREGLLDMVGMTRAHIADPHIVIKVMEQRERDIRPCVGATYCLDRIYQAGDALCIHNAATGRELSMPHIIEKADKQKKIVVVGTGPAGLEAARVAAERGHVVTVLEAAPEPGGQIRLTAQSVRRREMLSIIQWRMEQCESKGVAFRFNTYAETEDILPLDPDVVIVATGGQPNLSLFEKCQPLAHADSSWDIISGDVKLLERVLVYDESGDHPALQAAEVAANAGSEVEVMTPDRTFAPEIMAMNLTPYMRALQHKQVRFSVAERLLDVRREGNRLVASIGTDYSDYMYEKDVDQVVVNNGTLPVDDLYFALKPMASNAGAVDYDALTKGLSQTVVSNENGLFQLYRIGDAVSARNTHAAIYDALRLVKDL